MLKSLIDSVMQRRARELTAQFGEWLPTTGPVLDLGSGTGHIAARLREDRQLQVVTADVSDIHVVGPAPVLIGDGVLPFEAQKFSATLLVFMLAYPENPARLLAEAARVTRGPIIVVQTLHANLLGYVWFRAREFFWAFVAFYVSRLFGYVSRDAKFSMNARRFYTAETLRRDIHRAGLRIWSRRARAVLPGGSLVVATWRAEAA